MSIKFNVIAKIILIGSLCLCLTVGLVGAGLYTYYLKQIEPHLPVVDGLQDIQLQEPLRVYSAQGSLIAEYGEKRRIPISIDRTPQVLKNAFLAAEDDRYWVHPGVDYQGIARAAWVLLTTGERAQGGSTITMQVARNFFLSREKTYLRKINEIFLALRIEEKLTKNQILELYLNKIYLGQRAYGVAAAAKTYYGKPVSELSLAEIAMVAGLPKAPSRYNPIVNPERAQLRRNYVLRRMHQLDMITQADYETAVADPLTADRYDFSISLEAPYVAEMARDMAVEKYGTEVYSNGMKIYTTIDDTRQRAANAALRKGINAYERRRGYRGHAGSLQVALKDQLPQLQSYAEASLAQSEAVLDDDVSAVLRQTFTQQGRVAGLTPAVVIAVEDQSATVYTADGQVKVIDWQGLQWASPYLRLDAKGAAPDTASDVVSPLDVIWVEQNAEQIRLAQLPEVEGALVSLDPRNGNLQALVGGYDYYQSKFNRVTQAQRQPGSGFKPFVYSAALDHGYTTASIINDAPVVFDDPALEGQWRPKNYSGKFYGPTRLREALVQSRNLASIRLLIGIGRRTAQRHARRFGFDEAALPYDLSLVLGSGVATPLQMASAYAVFANGGYAVKPRFIDRIVDGQDYVIYIEPEQFVCQDCEVTETQYQLVSYTPQTPQSSMNKIEAYPPVPADRVITVSASDDTSKTPAEADVSDHSGNTLQALLQPETSPQDATQTMNRNLVIESQPRQAVVRVRSEAPRVLDARNAYLMNSLLRNVITQGTGRRALTLGRADLAGKTGTTNDQHDAWFNGFNNDLVTTVWLGFDNNSPLGAREAASKSALPVWIDYMRVALEDQPEHSLPQPAGLVSVRIDSQTGLLADPLSSNSLFELFKAETVPTEAALPAINTDSNYSIEADGGDVGLF